MPTTSTAAPADYATDSTYLALLAGVLAEPQRDDSRLVLAGWLEENGHEERAEFIRAQITSDGSEKQYRQEWLLWVHTGPGYLAGLPVCVQNLATIKRDVFNSDDAVVSLTQRGFVCEVRLSPADWFAHHAALYWQPGETVECERCQLLKIPGHCPRCEGKGRVTRPVPATAQPLTHVRLTEWPEHVFLHDGNCQLVGVGKPYWVPRGETFDHTPRGIATFLLAEEWPRIRFRLPGDEE